MSSDKWLLVGLGNPGKQYEKTRHNVGFQVIHRLAKQWEIPGKGETRFRGVLGQGMHNGNKIILLQPTTYMNLSGESARPVLDYFDVPEENLIVIYDDKDLPFGKIRIRAKGSAGSHNGMKSIIQHMGGNQQITRLKIGIGVPTDATGQKAGRLRDYVLQKFTPDEEVELENILDTCVAALNMLINKGVEAAMTTYNASE